MLFASLLALGTAAADAPGIQALWATFDDQGKPTGYVRISLHGEEYVGVVERGLPGDTKDRRCEACPGSMRDKNLLGLKILSGVHRHGESYIGGHIVDPFNGKEYRVRLTPSADGTRLTVRGFIGLEIFGRTQTWVREMK